MRSRISTVWAAIAAVALCSVAHGRRAVLVDEFEGGPMAKLYSLADLENSQSEVNARIREEAKKYYREGWVAEKVDLYRLASLLSTSDVPFDLLLAHDCALASLIEGFRPSLRTLKASQKRLLRSIGISSEREPEQSKAPRNVGVLDHLERSWSRAIKSSPPSQTRSVSLPVVN